MQKVNLNSIQKSLACAANLFTKGVNKVGKINIVFFGMLSYIACEKYLQKFSIQQFDQYKGYQQTLFYRKPTRSIYEDDDNFYNRYRKRQQSQ